MFPLISFLCGPGAASVGSPRPIEAAHNGPLEFLLSGGSSQKVFWAELNVAGAESSVSFLAEVDARSAIICMSLSASQIKREEK